MQEVHAYICAYTEHFHLWSKIRFNVQLISLKQCPVTLKWTALYVDVVTSRFFTVEADYAVICTGLYCTPHIPNYEVRLGVVWRKCRSA